MKPLPTVLIFVALVFGLGWTSRVLTEQIAGKAADPVVEPDRGERRSRGRGGRFGFPAGPYLGTAERFAEELELTAEQRQRLQEMIDEVADCVRGHERDMRKAVYDTKAQVDALLTAEQKTKLAEINKRKWEEYRARKRERTLRWLKEETALDDTGLARARVILEESEDARATCFQEMEKREGPPERGDRDKLRERLREISTHRDARLGELLSDEEFDRFQNAGLDRGRGHSDRGKRRGGRRRDREKKNES